MLNMLTRGTLALILFFITTMYNRYICRPISIGNKQQHILDKNIFFISSYSSDDNTSSPLSSIGSITYIYFMLSLLFHRDVNPH